MGVALTRAAQWTSAGSGTGTLEITPLNESLLNDIIKFAESFSSRHPQEAAFVFREPLEWKTQLDYSGFELGYEISGTTVQSEERDKDDQPLLLLSDSTIRVRSFGQLSRLLHVAMEKKLKEAQACLEANRDPIVKILGPGYGTIEGEDMSMLRLLDRMKKDDDPDTEIKMKISLLLQQLDMQLLNSSLKRISQEVRLTPAAVKNEVDLLKHFSGEGEDTVLESLEYISDYEFSNGCRAPPWRQVHGEICYLIVKPHDTDPLYITCSTAGVFLNGGREKEKDDIDYERKSDIYKDLITLLRERSPKFVENIAKQILKTRYNILNCKIRCLTKTNIFSDKAANKVIKEEKENRAIVPESKKKANILSPGPIKGQSVSKRKVSEKSDEISQTSSESEEDEEQPERHQEGNTDLPSEYWQIQKLVKYIKAGSRLSGACGQDPGWQGAGWQPEPQTGSELSGASSRDRRLAVR
ncbi:Armadillo repeat-containing protein 4 [Chelonia mydas]|uniref:Armadillo repeat-containing protein 4 n=1 Tax=Chelonia mydas TaxID=8469 RepID=M7B167_CHEMY|nr:Armadillo repeat-containing protein 4 [Chelonia mydas]